VQCYPRACDPRATLHNFGAQFFSVDLRTSQYLYTGILCHTVSELSRLIVQILNTLHFSATLWRGEGGIGTTYDVHLGLLIELFSLGVTAESLRAKRVRKSAISLWSGPFFPKFQVEGVAPTSHFCTDS